MGTVSPQENPEVTVSESKERQSHCWKARDDGHLRSAFVSVWRCPRRWQVVLSLEEKWSASWKATWCHFSSAYTELWMSCLLQRRKVALPRTAQKGMNWEEFDRRTGFSSRLSAVDQLSWVTWVPFLTPFSALFPRLLSPGESLSQLTHCIPFLSPFPSALRTQHFPAPPVLWRHSWHTAL